MNIERKGDRRTKQPKASLGVDLVKNPHMMLTDYTSQLYIIVEQINKNYNYLRIFRET